MIQTRREIDLFAAVDIAGSNFYRCSPYKADFFSASNLDAKKDRGVRGLNRAA